jgi:hypothetical protein
MDLRSRNGNGGAYLIPPTPKVLTGQSLVHRQLDKRQRAILAANIADGLMRFVPSKKQLAGLCNVSIPYIEIARRLSPDRRAAILNGRDSTSFAELLRPPRQLRLKLPAPMCASVTNLQLEHVIRTVGVERVLEAAVAVERFDETLAPAL